MAKGDSSSSGAAVNNANNMMQSSSGMRPGGFSNSMPNESAIRFNPGDSSLAPSQGMWSNMIGAGATGMGSMPIMGSQQTNNVLPNEQAMRMPMNSQQQMSNTNPMPSMAPTDMNALIQQFLMRLNGNNQPNASFVPGQGIR